MTWLFNNGKTIQINLGRQKKTKTFFFYQKLETFKLKKLQRNAFAFVTIV